MIETITARALEDSIVAWDEKVQLIIEGRTDEIIYGWTACPLCTLFHPNMKRAYPRDSRKCDGCPVKKRAQLCCCQDTPYEDFSAAMTVYSHCYDDNQEATLRYATQEVNFLLSLRDR